MHTRLLRGLQRPEGSCYGTYIEESPILLCFPCPHYVLYLQSEVAISQLHMYCQNGNYGSKESYIIQFKIKGQLHHILTSLIKIMLRQHKKPASEYELL